MVAERRAFPVGVNSQSSHPRWQAAQRLPDPILSLAVHTLTIPDPLHFVQKPVGLVGPTRR